MKSALACGVVWLATLAFQSTRPQSAPEPRFFLHGTVDRPGPRPLPARYTVLDLFADTPAPVGARVDRVLLIHQDRRDPQVFEIDVRTMVLTGDTKSNLRILDGDIVYFVRS